MSIFSKLFKLFLTVVLLPLVPMAMILVYYQTHLKDNILETHSNLAAIVSSSIHQHLEDLTWRLAFARRVESALAARKTPLPALNDALAANPDFLMLAVLNKDGREIYRAGDPRVLDAVEKVDLKGDPALEESSRAPRVSVSGFEVVQGMPVSEFLYPLSNGDYLYGVMSFFSFLSRVQEQRIGTTGRIFIADGEGRFFDGGYPYAPAVEPAALKAALARPDGLIKNLKGKDFSYVGAFSATPVLGTYAVVLQNKDEALRGVYYSNVIILLFMVAIVTLAYFGALSFAESLGQPIEELAKGAAAVSAGDLDQKLDENVGWKEFNQLIAAFNKMTADLKDYQVLQLQAQVSEMKEHVFRAVAHDLRAPLLGLQGYLYILESGKATDAEKKEYLALMSQAAKNLSALLEDVLDVSRITAGMLAPKKQTVALEPLLQNVYNTLKPAADEKGLDLSVQCAADACAQADPKLLLRVMTNLASNAVKFTQKGFVRLSARQDEKACYLSVQDSGIGLAEKDQKIIFEKYRQVSPGEGGYGLGLFISRQIARAHGGELEVKSAPGQGSVFTLTLPKEEVA